LRLPRGGRDWLAAGVAAMVLDPPAGTAPGIHFAPTCSRPGLNATVAERSNREPLVHHFDDGLRIAFAAHLAA